MEDLINKLREEAQRPTKNGMVEYDRFKMLMDVADELERLLQKEEALFSGGEKE